MKASIMVLKIGGRIIIYVHCFELLINNKKRGKKK